MAKNDFIAEFCKKILAFSLMRTHPFSHHSNRRLSLHLSKIPSEVKRKPGIRQADKS